jgi:hypothetical protein
VIEANYALRLQASVKREAKRVAHPKGTTPNQFISVAVAEKLSALRTADYFRERAARAEISSALELLDRAGDQPPRDGDEIVLCLRAPCRLQSSARTAGRRR